MKKRYLQLLLLYNTIRAKEVEATLAIDNTKYKLYDGLRRKMDKDKFPNSVGIAKSIAKIEGLNLWEETRVRDGLVTEKQSINIKVKQNILSGDMLGNSVESILNMADERIANGRLENKEVKDCLDKNFHYEVGYGREYIAPENPMPIVILMEKALEVH